MRFGIVSTNPLFRSSSKICVAIKPLPPERSTLVIFEFIMMIGKDVESCLVKRKEILMAALCLIYVALFVGAIILPTDVRQSMVANLKTARWRRPHEESAIGI